MSGNVKDMGALLGAEFGQPRPPAPPAVREVQPPAPVDDTPEYVAQPKVRVAPDPMHFAFPPQLALSRRLRLYKASTGVDISDAAAEAINNYLREKGF